MFSNRDAAVLLGHRVGVLARLAAEVGHEVAAAELVRRPPEGLRRDRGVVAGARSGLGIPHQRLGLAPVLRDGTDDVAQGRAPCRRCPIRSPRLRSARTPACAYRGDLEEPCAALPLACTTRSGTRSRLKCCIFCTTWASWSTVGPFGRTASECSSLATRTPDAFVVRCSAMEAKLRSS